MTYTIKQSSTEAVLLFFLVQTSDHITGLTGATPTVTLSKNGAPFASPSGAVSEIGNGVYKVAANATDTNTLGPIWLHATAALGDPYDNVVANIVAYDPQDGVHLGLSALPNTACTGNASLITSGSGTDQLTIASGIASADAKKINAVSTASVTTVNANVGTTQPVNFTGAAASALVKSDMTDIAGAAVSASTAQLGVNVVNIGGSVSAGAAGYAAPDWGHVNAPTTVVDLSGTTIKNLDGNTVQTGDAYALMNGTTTEPTSVPAATVSRALKIDYLFTKTRNKSTQTATTQLVRNDADLATIATVTVSDDGTVFTKGKDT